MHAQSIHQSPIRRLYTECDLRRVGYEGLQACSSRVVQTPNFSVPPADTDTLTAVPPPNYGSFTTPHRRYTASASADDDHHDVEGCSPPMTEMMSFETVSSAASPRWCWRQWRRWRMWLSLEAVTLADSIDKYSRVGFPFVFVVLSVVYWAIYLQIRPAEFSDDFVIID